MFPPMFEFAVSAVHDDLSISVNVRNVRAEVDAKKEDTQLALPSAWSLHTPVHDLHHVDRPQRAATHPLTNDHCR